MSTGNGQDQQVDELLSETQSTADEALQWLQAVWQFFLATGLYFAGGPAGESSRDRLRLVDRAQRVATEHPDGRVSAEANRITAHVMNAAEQYSKAIEFYPMAITQLELNGEFEQAVRTRLGYSAALMMLGRYDKALETCNIADEWFVDNGDMSGHARVLINAANIWHRLDEHRKALDNQLEAAEIFRIAGDLNDLAAVKINIANSYSFLGRFDDSEASYFEAEKVANAAGLQSVVDQARYNRTYLHFLRGYYSQAVDSFRALRLEFQKSGSERHAALCSLDEAEVCLHLNLGENAVVLARESRTAFVSLGMVYEAAKATVFEAVGEMLRSRFKEGLELLSEAGPQFLEEGNDFWLGVTDLYRAEILLALDRLAEARFWAQCAVQRFERMNIPYQLGMSLVVQGRLALLADDDLALADSTRKLVSMVENQQQPLVAVPAYMLCGESSVRNKNTDEARRWFELAAKALEDHRNCLHHDELKVRYLEGKEKVYEYLVQLELRESDSIAVGKAFIWCEKAKARSLADLVGQHLPVVRTVADAALSEEMNHLRETLNSKYVQARHGSSNLVNHHDLDRVAHDLDRNLQRMAALDLNFASLLNIKTSSLDETRAALSPDTTLAEYFIVRGEVLVFLLNKQGVRVYRQLASLSRVQKLKQDLSYQMKKCALYSAHQQPIDSAMLEATNGCLDRLFELLVQSWIDDVQTERLVIVPHGVLHGLPFHAFRSGKRYLVDEFKLNYAPSAEVLRLVTARPDVDYSSPGLLIGVADELAPGIEAEVTELHALLPKATLLKNHDASFDAVFAAAAGARFLHVACHATYRDDNPMYSSFRLGDRPVTALDLLGQSFSCDLVTMSGCSSGVSAISGGDELLGLTRGLFHAGARSVLVSQWNVNDMATRELMRVFYEHWLESGNKSVSLAKSMCHVRETNPHPFYWAPFTLIGAG